MDTATRPNRPALDPRRFSEANEPAPRVRDSDLALQRAYRWARERPQDVYLVQPVAGGVRRLTWSEVLDQARRMASYLQSLDLPEKSRIALVTKNCAHFFVMDLAIWMTGHVSVALYPTIGADTLRYVLEDCDAKLLFVGKLDTWDEMKLGVPDGVACIACELSPKTSFPQWNDILQAHEPIAGEPVRDAGDTAILMYTSGSTGHPKAVAQSFEAMMYPAKAVAHLFRLSAEDRFVSYLPLAHTFERAIVELPSLHHGCRVFFVESLETFASDLQRARPTVFQSVPRLWLKFRDGVHAKIPAKTLSALLRMPILSRLMRKKVLAGLGLDAVRFAFTGSAPISAEILDWYHALGVELLEGYGMSENFAYCTLSRPGRMRVGWVGEPLPGVSLRIAEDGEVQMRGPATMQRYEGRPELTEETFTADGWLRTGDCGTLDETGRLRITGRVKEIFKTSKAKYVSPAPIENLLNNGPLVEQSCVMGVGEPQPFGAVMLSESWRDRSRSDVSAALENLLDEVNARLEHHERLAFVVVSADEWTIESGMLTPTMKIKRAALEARFGDLKDNGERVRWERITFLVPA